MTCRLVLPFRVSKKLIECSLVQSVLGDKLIALSTIGIAGISGIPYALADFYKNFVLLNKLVLANLGHRPARTLLSVLAIAVEVTMILTLVGVSHGTLGQSVRRARGAGADI
jgi:hypothetical protein